MIFNGKIEDLEIVRNGDYVEYWLPERVHMLWRYNKLQTDSFVGKPGCQTKEEFEEGVRLCLEARIPLVRPANILDWGDPVKEML